MTAYRLELDSIACIGCAACTRCEFIEMGPDMKAHAVKNRVPENDCLKEVVESCPVGAIVFKRISSCEPAD